MLGKTNKGIITTLMVAIVLLVIATFVVRAIEHEDQHRYALSGVANIDGVVLVQPRVLPQFTMVADDGRVFTKDDIKGHWTLMFFWLNSLCCCLR